MRKCTRLPEIEPVTRLPPRSLRQALAHVGAVLLPSACALCGARCRAALCASCHGQFLGAARPRCQRCGNPIGAADRAWPCGACQANGPPFDATVAAADYAAPLDQLVQQLKFDGMLALAPCFGEALREALVADGRGLPELLCPVPLGPARLVERGFNQALEIARPLAKSLRIALEPALAVRVRDTAAQSSVAPAQRQRNLHRAFTLAPHAVALVQGCHIGVVDDVMTSGATLAEMAAMLKRFGAARVTNLVFARTPPH